MLTVAVVTPLSGTLADRFGLHAVYGGGLVLFCAGAALCALAGRLETLLAARVLQAMGGAMLLPLGRLAVLRSHPPEGRVAALALVGLPGLLGPLIGPALGGLLVTHAGWRWVFLAVIAPAILGAELVRRRMPRFPRHVVAFDAGGYLLIATAVVSAILGLRSLASGGGWTGPLLLTAGAGLTAAYLRHAARRPAPLLPLAAFRNARYARGMVGNFVSRVVSGAMPFLLATLLQVGLGFDAARAGVLMLAAGAGALSSKALADLLIRRCGHVEVLATAGVLLAGLMAAFACAHSGLPLSAIAALLALYGAVNSLLITCMSTFTLARLDAQSASAANSSFSLMVQLAASVAVSIAGVLLQGAQRLGAGPLDALRIALIGLALCPAAGALIFLRGRRCSP